MALFFETTLDIGSFLYKSFLRQLLRCKPMAKAVSACILLSLFITTPVQAAKVLILGDSLGASYGMSEQVGWVALLQKNKVLLTEIMVPPNYGPRYSQKFTQVYQEIAKDEDIDLIPFFMQEVAPHPELMQRDGIHPNEKAQEKIATWMQPWIEKALTQ